jgi:hypothetical protein
LYIKVYKNNNGLSSISLAGPSFINASPINKIKLPSIKELDNMIINAMPTNQPMATKSTTLPQLPPIMSTTTTKRPFSVIVEQGYRTTTKQNNCPLKQVMFDKKNVYKITIKYLLFYYNRIKKIRRN